MQLSARPSNGSVINGMSITVVGISEDVATDDVPPWAVQLAVPGHGSVIGSRTVIVIVFPETCTSVVNLTAGSAVEKLNQG